MGAGTIMVPRAVAEAGHPKVTLICGADFIIFYSTTRRSEQQSPPAC